MVNHLSKFTPNLSKLLWELLNKNHWVWGEPQHEAFQEIKQALILNPVLALFDPNCETVVSADASSYGLGAVLLQKQPNELKPIAYISRSLTPTEQPYAQIVTWTCERFSDYLLGLTFRIQTGHKPLVLLFSSKNLDELPIRVQWFRLWMMRFSFTILHVPGKSLLAADTLSRAPCSDPVDKDTLLQQETAVYVNTVVQSLPATERQLERIRQDPRGGWSVSTSGSLLPVRMALKTDDSWSNTTVLSCSSWTVSREWITDAREQNCYTSSTPTWNVGQNSHWTPGNNKCCERARQSIWWPGFWRR